MATWSLSSNSEIQRSESLTDCKAEGGFKSRPHLLQLFGTIAAMLVVKLQNSFVDCKTKLLSIDMGMSR